MGVMCQYCNKEFISYQSRCNHVRKFHNSNKPTITTKLPQFDENVPQKTTKITKNDCEYCHKKLSRYDSLHP